MSFIPAARGGGELQVNAWNWRPTLELLLDDQSANPLEIGMANKFDDVPSTRRYQRVTGPFDGFLESRVLVYDLNLGGCFVNSSQELPEGTTSILRISLPQEGWITVNAETLYPLQHGFAVRFLALDRDTEARIARTVTALKR